MDNTEVEIFSVLASLLISLPGIRQVTPTSDLRRDLGITSLDLIGICQKVEDHFGISIDDLSFSGVNTFQDAVGYIRLLWDKNNHLMMSA